MKSILKIVFSGLFLCTLFASAYADGHGGECVADSKWGPDDEIGSANYVTTKRVKNASKLVKKGESHPLGIVISSKTPAFPPRNLNLQIVAPGQIAGKNLAGAFGWHISYNDDLMTTWIGIGPQLDGLGHLGENDCLYNGNKQGDIAQMTGLTKLGTHQIPPMIARGVLINMAKHFGVESMEAGQAITTEDIKAAMKAQKIKINEGDVVIFHTGWTDAKLEADPTAWVSGEPGTDNAAMEYLMTFNPMAVGADTWGVEAVPPVKGDKVFYGHVTALKNNGVYLLETMNTGRLANEGVTEFMFVLGQARIKGTVQAIINPVAMW